MVEIFGFREAFFLGRALLASSSLLSPTSSSLSPSVSFLFLEEVGLIESMSPDSLIKSMKSKHLCS